MTPSALHCSRACRVADSSGPGKEAFQFLVLVDPEKKGPQQTPVSVSLADLGITGKAMIHAYLVVSTSHS